MATTRRLPREARRAQVIEAAARAFLARGYDGTSMEDVAAEAGVSRLVLYRVVDSKPALYRAVLLGVLESLASSFAALGVDDVRQRGASTLIVPVARDHPDAFRLLWRHAWREPDFAELSELLRTSVTAYAAAILRPSISDEVVLAWAAQTAGAHLMEGICAWLDGGDPDRDGEVAVLLRDGIRAMAAAWGSAGG